ncbi:hypothetical protein [Micromonospora sp. URMC 103]|uniref:hypothetical protein n=1 Tax=Micromonospora sp. URMC 103 TaxID=3423406 RepID=UPI003F1953FA
MAKSSVTTAMAASAKDVSSVALALRPALVAGVREHVTALFNGPAGQNVNDRRR